MTRLAIVIPTWNRAEMLAETLGSLGRQTHPIDRVIVVDNGSTDDTAKVARQAGTQAEFVAGPEDAGEWLAREARGGDVILLKASRGGKLEKALETWKARRDGGEK